MPHPSPITSFTQGAVGDLFSRRKSDIWSKAAFMVWLANPVHYPSTCIEILSTTLQPMAQMSWNKIKKKLQRKFKAPEDEFTVHKCAGCDRLNNLARVKKSLVFILQQSFVLSRGEIISVKAHLRVQILVSYMGEKSISGQSYVNNLIYFER